MSSVAEREILIGTQSSFGTGATVDKALRAKGQLRIVANKKTVDEDIGSFAHGRRYVASKHLEGSIEMDGYYEDAPYMISMAMGAAAVTGSADPWTWTWTFPDETAITPVGHTVETTDGSNHVHHGEDVIAIEMEISGTAGEGIMIKNTLAGGNVTRPAAVGASLDPLATVTDMLMADTSLHIDDDFGNVGTTEIGVMIDFTLKLSGMMHTKQFANSLYPTSRGFDKYKLELNLTVEVDNTDIEAEIDKIASNSLSSIQIKSSASSNDEMTLQHVFQLISYETLDSRDGNNTIKLNYESQKDSSDNTGTLVIKTNLEAL